MSLRKGTVERLTLALGQDANIVTMISQIDQATGHTEEYLTSLGLTKSDLLRLERARLALRGYTKEKKGARVRWLLLGDDSNVNSGSDSKQEAVPSAQHGEVADGGRGQ